MTLPERALRCPTCGKRFTAPNLRHITLSIEAAENDGIQIVIRLDTFFRHRRDVIHECPAGGSGGGDEAPVPAWPLEPRPSKGAYISLTRRQL